MAAELWTIVGSLSGVAVGFGLYTLRDHLKQRSEVKRLARSLRTEAFLLLVSVRHSLRKIEELERCLAQGDLVRSEFREKLDEPSVYRANLANVSALPERIAMALAVFHGLEVNLSANAKLMATHFEDFYSANPMVSKEQILEEITHYKESATALVKVGTVVIGMIDEHFKPKDLDAWLIEAKTPGQLVFLLSKKRNSQEAPQ